MFTLVEVGVYACLLTVLGMMVIRERRRARNLSRVQRGVIPRALIDDDSL